MWFRRYFHEHKTVIMFCCAMGMAFLLLFVPYYNKNKSAVIVIQEVPVGGPYSPYYESIRSANAEGDTADAIVPDDTDSAAAEGMAEDDTAVEFGAEKLNINTATAEQLQTLPGIGEELSRRIIDYRGQRIQFQDIRELIKVPGIGTKRFDAIKELICLE